MKDDSFRGRLCAHIRRKYGAQPERLWARYPDYLVFRRADNRKWFALVMNLPRLKLGLAGEAEVDVLNVKLPDARLVDLLCEQPGYLPGYHISRGSWVSILLDGTVPMEEIRHWLAESYAAVGPKTKRGGVQP